MFKLIKNIDVYDPAPNGRMDILICNDKIIKLSQNIDFPTESFDTEVIDGTKLKAVEKAVLLPEHQKYNCLP